MVASYSDIIWATVFVEQLTAQEAIVLLASCSLAWRTMKAYLAPLAFAITRPKPRTKGPPLSVKSWSRLWQMCAASVNHHGLSAGFWARAEKVVSTRILSGYEIYNRREIRFNRNHPFLDNSLKYIMEYHFPEGFDLHQVQISAILMLGARIERPEAQILDEKCHALVVLANNLLAWICTSHINYQASSGKVWFHEDLDSLLLMVPAAWTL